MAYDSDLSRTKNWGTEILTDSDLEGQFDLIINWIMAAFNTTTGHNHDGTSNHGPKIPIGSLTVASQAQGDIIYASSASAWVRLAKGTALQVLRMNSGATAPEWAASTSAASQAEQETGTEAAKYVAPATQKFHPSAAKAWCVWNGATAGTNAPTAGYNVTSVTKDSQGNWTVNLTTAFSGAVFAPFASSQSSSYMITNAVPTAAGTFTVTCRDFAGNAQDAVMTAVAYGDQA